jgi:hypothetical protein
MSRSLLPLLALVLGVAAQTPPIEPFFFSGMSVQFVVVAVLVTIGWAFLPIWFRTVGDTGVLDSADYGTIRSGIAARFCGFLLLRRGVEKTLELLSAVFFIVAAALYLVQPMLQFPVDDAGNVLEETLTQEIANANTLWVPIVIVAYAAWFVQRLASGVFHSISEFGWSAFASFVAWAGWLALVVLLALELANCEPGQELTAEIVLLIFAALQFLWSTYLAFWRAGFAYVASDLAIGPRAYEVVGASAGGKRA